MTQDDTHPPTLGDKAARIGEQLEDWTPGDGGDIMRDFAATGMGAEVGTNGTIRSAWIVIDPNGPRIEFDPTGAGDSGSLTLYDGTERHRTHVQPCAAVDYARSLVLAHFDGMEIDA